MGVMTVGELVKAKWPMAHVLSGLSDEGAAMASTISRIYETILSSLGIWDAEVLEGKVTER